MAYMDVWDVTAPLDTQTANQGAADFRATKLDIMQRVASFGAGLLANRPTPEVTGVTANWTGVMYWATDTQQVFMWTGAAWTDISASLPSNANAALALATTGAPVNVSAAVPPTVGQVLEATDATHATWQSVSTIASGFVPVNLTAQAANVVQTTLYVVPVGKTGFYRVSGNVILTQAAGVSSVLPALSIVFTDPITSLVSLVTAITATYNGNQVPGQSLGVAGGNGSMTVYAKAGTSISYQISGYASAGAPVMQYAVSIRLEYLGA